MKTKTPLPLVAFWIGLLAAAVTSYADNVSKPQPQPYEWPDNQPEACPFPESGEVTKIVFTGRYANYTGADTWFPMWAADGNEYSPFTDGNVYGYKCYGHFSNTLEGLQGKNHHTGQASLVGDSPTALKLTNLGRISTPYDNFYPCASVIADGVWYYGHYNAFNNEGYFAGWRYSTNWNHFTEEQNYPWENPYWTSAYDVSDQARFFDFGPDSEVEPGHIGLNAQSLYDPAKGYGWDAPLTGDLVRDNPIKTMKDLSYCNEPRTLKVDLENGDYRILLYMGDRGPFAHDNMAVSAEGTYAISRSGSAKSSTGKVSTAPGAIRSLQFNVTVTDGQLDLRFEDKGGKDNNWVVNALYVKAHNDDNFFNEKGKAKFRVPRAVVFGQDNKLSPDGKIYLVSHGYSKGTGTNNWANGDALYLCRVDEGIPNVTDPEKYEFWDGNKWADTVEEARPFLEWPDNLGGATITWNPGLEKYILVVHHNDNPGASVGDDAKAHRTILMEADEITGPYKTIHFMQEWGPGSYFGNIPAKWISEDGKTAWLVIAANCWGDPHVPYQCQYACSMHEIRFVTEEDTE